MTGVELLIDMIQTRNQVTLDEAKVKLSTSNIRFTDLYPGDYPDGMNTSVGAEAFGWQIEGTYSYNYKRYDIQEAFVEIGEPVVVVEVQGTPDFSKIMLALLAKYNLILPIEDIQEFELVGDVATITIKPTSYIWLGSLTVNVTNGTLTFASQFPNNVLNGLTAPDKDPLADGGNYDQLTGSQV